MRILQNTSAFLKFVYVMLVILKFDYDVLPSTRIFILEKKLKQKTFP